MINAEEQNKYIIDCAKKEIAFYYALIKDWELYPYEDRFEKYTEWFKNRGCEINEDSRDEYDTHNKQGEEEHRRQVDILGTFCGFTLQEINGKTEIGYIWVFTGGCDELYIDTKGRVRQ